MDTAPGFYRFNGHLLQEIVRMVPEIRLQNPLIRNIFKQELVAGPLFLISGY